MDKAIRDKLVSALIRYDERQKKSRHYNPYAIGIYLGGLDRAEERMSEGMGLREALRASFHGRLLEALFKAADEARATDAEVRGDYNALPL